MKAGDGDRSRILWDTATRRIHIIIERYFQRGLFDFRYDLKLDLFIEKISYI